MKPLLEEISLGIYPLTLLGSPKALSSRDKSLDIPLLPQFWGIGFAKGGYCWDLGFVSCQKCGSFLADEM